MQERSLGIGLFLTTLATLLLELLDARLLSVLTWYHLSFLALSLAMLGGAGGAVLVRGGLRGARAPHNSAAGDGAIALPVGLEELSTIGLTEVLDSLDLFMPASEFIPPSFDELDEEQLRALLAAMEG